MPKQSNKITITLSRDEVGQILDGLEVRRDAWLYTQRYLEDGYCDGEQIIEECSNPDEARNIAETYEAIINKIYAQLKSQ